LISGIFINLNAQESYSDKKHELNLGYFNLFRFDDPTNIGIGYKFNFNEKAIRISSDFAFKNNDINLLEYEYFKYNIRMGFEFEENINKFQYFYGSDLLFGHTKHMEYANNIYAFYVRMKNINEYGVCPFVGLKFFINKRISISTETNVRFSITKYRYDYYNYSDNNKINIDEFLGTATIISLSPIGILTLNIHL
jgi:hypothetical protein